MGHPSEAVWSWPGSLWCVFGAVMVVVNAGGGPDVIVYSFRIFEIPLL